MNWNNSSKGALAGISAALMWGAAGLYWGLLRPTPAFEILCYRILFSLVLILPLILLSKRWHEVSYALRHKHILKKILCSTTLICINWLTYIWAVNNGHVLETSLGYYINPLLCVGLGSLLLKEKISRLQTIAIIMASLGVIMALIIYGSFPWIAFVIATSFALYGFVRKTVQMEAVPGLCLETMLLCPMALAGIIWYTAHGEGFLTHPAPTMGLLLFLSGAVTSIPLTLFAYASRRLRYMTLGLLLYLSPSFLFLAGLFYFQEELHLGYKIMFICIWTGLAIYTFDTWLTTRKNKL